MRVAGIPFIEPRLRCQRPLDRKSGIIPSCATERLRVVGRRNGIKHLRGILQRLKAVGAAFWDKKPDPILLGELDAFPFSKSGRPRPQIESHIKERAPRAAHQLGLLMRCLLEMHATKGATMLVERGIALRKTSRKAVGSKFLLTPSACKPPAIILMTLGLDDPDPGDAGGNKLHATVSLGSGMTKRPPLARKSCCWAITSSAKFQTSSTA